MEDTEYDDKLCYTAIVCADYNNEILLNHILCVGCDKPLLVQKDLKFYFHDLFKNAPCNCIEPIKGGKGYCPDCFLEKYDVLEEEEFEMSRIDRWFKLKICKKLPTSRNAKNPNKVV